MKNSIDQYRQIQYFSCLNSLDIDNLSKSLPKYLILKRDICRRINDTNCEIELTELYSMLEYCNDIIKKTLML